MIDVASPQSFEPNWAVPPGATIAAMLAAHSLSRESFATEIGESLETIRRLLLGLQSVDAPLAEKLSKCLGSTSAFWMAREAQYRADFERLQVYEESSALERWVKQFPVREMVKLGWIPDFKSPAEGVQACLGFFGVSDTATWNSRYSGMTATAAFRMSTVAKSTPGAVTAWLRWAELVAHRTECSAWDPKEFQDRLKAIRSLTWQKDPQSFLPKLRRMCAEAGVAVVVARTPSGCPASGATRFLSNQKALIVLSFRYRSDDQFWFTFFHEAGHLLLHGADALFIEDGSEITSTEENEANAFAAAQLVPIDRQAELSSIQIDRETILRFATQVGVAPGIIVGQLQHLGRVSHDRMNWLKRRYDWGQVEVDQLSP
jgi:HTH-type transcriptional regulator/antitoxin HigA